MTWEDRVVAAARALRAAEKELQELAKHGWKPDAYRIYSDRIDVARVLLDAALEAPYLCIYCEAGLNDKDDGKTAHRPSAAGVRCSRETK